MGATGPADKDSDGDGVADRLDSCPNTPAGRKVNTEGCEIDSEGLVDADDSCPTVYARTANGCPEPMVPVPVVPARPVPDDVNFDRDEAAPRTEPRDGRNPGLERRPDRSGRTRRQPGERGLQHGAVAAPRRSSAIWSKRVCHRRCWSSRATGNLSR